MASPQETIEAMLERSGRDHVPIRRSFVQAPRRGGGAGPVASFVHQHRSRTLDLYLLAHALASAPPYDVSFPSRVWARALGIESQSTAASTISKQWSWLEQQQLIASNRSGRHRRVILLREDGSGKDYVHPGREGHYFKLPYAYWRANHQNRLSLPAKAVLLIALSLEDDFLLPTKQGATWYGLSRDTVRKGLRTLRLFGLLEMRELRKNAPLSPLGFSFDRHYSLREPYRPMPRGETPERHGDGETE